MASWQEIVGVHHLWYICLYQREKLEFIWYNKVCLVCEHLTLSTKLGGIPSQYLPMKLTILVSILLQLPSLWAWTFITISTRLCQASIQYIIITCSQRTISLGKLSHLLIINWMCNGHVHLFWQKHKDRDMHRIYLSTAPNSPLKTNYQCNKYIAT